MSDELQQPRHPNTAQRQSWMALLARAPSDALEALVADAGEEIDYRLPRPAETGLCLVRGRIGGDGARFNLGEMTLTRCVVQLPDATTGVAYVAGRDRRHAELAALADALLQNGRLEEQRLEPLREDIEKRRRQRASAVASTRVDFFTLVRGEDAS